MNERRRGRPGHTQRLALFDIDGTLLPGASSERRFAAYLFRHGEMGILQSLRWLALLPRGLWHDGLAATKKNKAYLVGLDLGHVHALADAFVEKELLSALDRAVVQALLGHCNRGDRTVLLSGTLQPLTDALAARLGVPLAIGTLLPERKGRYLSGIPTRHPFAGEKLRIAERLCGDYALGFEQVIAYADSIHDRLLLERAGEAVAVEPDAALARLAAERRWRVLRHSGSGPTLECSPG